MEYKISDRIVNKRYVLTKDRFSKLQNPENLYVVKCVADPDVDEGPHAINQRGFFSLFLQAIQGLYFCTELGIRCYIDFGDPILLYSDPEKFGGDKNLWNYYFEQPFLDFIPQDKYPLINSYYETYPLRIWNDFFIKKSGAIVRKYIRFKQPVVEKLEILKNEFLQFNILGVQIRKTDHAGVSQIETERFIKYIEKEHFDKLFVATDDVSVIEELVNAFGKEKVIYSQVTRSSDQTPVHLDPKNVHKYELGLEVLVDTYCLSRCQKAILMHSNISYGALFFNPEMPYILMENLDTKIKRWQTGLLYKLHRYGIRSL